MIMFAFTSSAIVSKDLDDVEKRFGFTFPAELRELYLQFNGGRPDKDRFVDGRGTCIVDAFLPVRYPAPHLGTIELSIQRIKNDRLLLPDHLVQFAIDPFGNYYCFSTRASDYGAVFLVLMDHNDVRPATENLAPSIGAFLAMLQHK